MKRSFLFIGEIGVVLLLIASNVVAGPFGLEMGMSLNDLRRVANPTPGKQPNVWHLTKVPVPHDAFEFYSVNLAPGVGICSITAYGQTVKTSVYGDTIRREFSSLEDALTEKYGKNRKFDFLRKGSIWKEPNDWMMGLLKGERNLTAFWGPENGSKMSDEVVSIQLKAEALNAESGFVTAVYVFSIAQKCADDYRRDLKRGL